MKKVLVFVHSFDVGGVTAVIKSIYDNVDKNKVKIDFVRAKTNINDFDKKVFADGNKVYYYTNPKMGQIPILNYVIFRHNIANQVLKQIKNEKYDCIYIHSNAIIGLYIGIKAKIPIRIAHFHEATPDFGEGGNKSIIMRAVRKWRQKKYNKWATVKAGDSLKSCKVKYGGNVANDKKLAVLHPPVNTQKFEAEKYNREEIIKEFGIDTEAFNMLHTGRLCTIKNQSFLIDILCDMNKIKKTDLYIIGSGEIKEKLIKKAEELQVGSHLHILPPDTTAGIYLAMNCSLLPSFSEAFGMVAVESQFMGVPCFASENVPEDVNAGMCEFLSLESGSKAWADAILKYDYDNAHITDEKKEEFSPKCLADKFLEIIER